MFSEFTVRTMTTAKDSLKLCDLFEAELLAELMLRHWQHPLADDLEFHNLLLEAATEVLRASTHNQQFIDKMPPQAMNLVAAIWCAESMALEENSVCDDAEREQRINWLDVVRKSLPSCFCDPDLLE